MNRTKIMDWRLIWPACTAAIVLALAGSWASAAEVSDAFATTPRLAAPKTLAVLDELERWLVERGASQQDRQQ
ncbi:MAG TPA: hypothetical protein VIK18_02485, partial [Pirellulales bacterium]